MPTSTLKEKTAKGLFWGGVSNGVQQILGALLGIYLARNLSADDYGLTGMLAIFSGIAASIINSGFSTALTNKQDATHVDYNAVFWFTFFTGLALYLILYVSAPLISAFYDREELTSLSRVVFISFFFSGLAIVPYTIMFKNLMVKQQAQIDIIAMIASCVVGVVLVRKGFTYWALALQSVTYIVAGSVMRCVVAPWRPTAQLNFTPLKGMLSFSMKLFFTSIFQQINNNIFSVLLGKLYNATQLGYYSQGNKWMLQGNQILTGMVLGVAQPVIVQLNDEKERQTRVFRKMTRFAAFISFPSFLGLAFIAEEFIVLAIGDSWLPSIIFLQILCLWGLASPFNTLYSQLLLSHGKSNIYLWGNVLIGISQIIILIIMYKFGVLYMVIGYVVNYICSIFFWHYYSKRLIDITLIGLLKDISPYLIISVLSILGAAFVTSFIHNMYLVLAGKILITALLYISILWFADSRILKESIQLIKRK